MLLVLELELELESDDEVDESESLVDELDELGLLKCKIKSILHSSSLLATIKYHFLSNEMNI